MIRAWLLLAACAPVHAAIESDAPDDGDGASYRAISLATALNRMAVYRATTTDCAWFVLVNPYTSSGDVALPPDWAVESAARGGLADCEAYIPPSGDPAVSVSGLVDFEPVPDFGFPPALDVELTLTFSDASSVIFSASALPVDSGG